MLNIIVLWSQAIFTIIKMVPLKTTKRVLIWLSMCKPDAPFTVCEKFTHYSLLLIYINSMVWTFIACLLFFIRFVSIDLTESLYALINITSSTDIIYGFIIGYINREKISMLFKNLSKIYEARKLYQRYWNLKHIALN